MEFIADAVVICAGGFELSRERVARYVDGGDLYTIRGSPYNTGEVIEATLGPEHSRRATGRRSTRR